MSDGVSARVRATLRAHAEDVRLVQLLHDVPPHCVYEVTVDGRRAVCKVATGSQAHLEREAHVLRHVGRQTSLPVPEVLAAGEGYFVAEWLETVPDPDESPADAAWARSAGAGLATLHAETAFGAPGVLRASDGGLAVDACRTTAEALAAYLDDLRPGVVGTGYVDVVDDVVAFLEANRGAFEAHGGAGEPVLCHGNWLREHVGVDGDDVTAVIDFERALVTPAEHDYWRAALPLFYGGSESDDAAREAFRAGYESVRPLPPGFEQRRDLHWLVITASFVESLFVQDEHGPGETERLAEWLRERVEELIADLEAARD